MSRLLKNTLFLGFCLLLGSVNTLLVADVQKNEIQESGVNEIIESQYYSYIKEHPLVIVDIYAPWCPPCKRLAPVMEELSCNHGSLSKKENRICFVKINLDQNSSVGAKLEVRSIPTLLFYRDGEEVGRVVGFKSYDELEKLIDQCFFNKQ
jgi:thioredoxin 1